MRKTATPTHSNFLRYRIMDTNSETIESLLARLLDDMEFLGLIKLMPGTKKLAIEGKPQAEDQNNTSKNAVAA